MPAKRIDQIVKGLPFEKKLLIAGSILMVISVFLPWYADRDSFNTGDTFLGVSGPLYLAGLTILVLAVMNITLIIMDSIGRRMPLGGISSSKFFLASGLVAFYLLMIVNSVYFHNKFGVNITFKESPFGMFSAFIAASLMTIGGYLATRERGSIVKEFQEKAQESLIKTPDAADTRTPDIRKPKENIRNMNTPAPVSSPTQTQIAEPEEATPNKSYQQYRSDL